MQYNPNPLSWSISRSTLLYYCNKKYFFTYYGNWLKEFDQTIWLETLLVKNLKSLDMRIGEKIHNLISDYLNQLVKNSPDVDKLLQSYFTNIDQEYQLSKTRDYEKYNKDNKFGLSEHYYGQDVDALFEAAKSKITTQFNNFLSSPIHKEIQGYIDTKQKLFIEQKQVDFDQMKIIIDNVPELMGITLRAQPDFGVITSDSKYVIFDWKTGKIPTYPHEYISDQLKVYAYKLLSKIGMEKYTEIQIYAYELYLADSQIYGGRLEYDDIINIQNKIVEDIAFEKKFIVDGDADKNIPLPTHYFPRTHQLKKCEICRFRKVCEDLKHYEPQDVVENKIENITDVIEDDDLPF